MIVIMTTDFTFHGFDHLLLSQWTFGLFCWCLQQNGKTKFTMKIGCRKKGPFFG